MLEHLPAAIGRALSGMRPGMEALTMAASDLAVPGRAIAAITLTSAAFADGAALPVSATDDGDGLSPPLAWSDAPAGSAGLALIVEDADSPTGRPLVHAIAAPIALDLHGFAAGGLDEAATGRNSFLSEAWLPPDPPPGHGPHRYVFQLFALDAPVAEIKGRGGLQAAIRGHVIGLGVLVGTYGREA